MEASNKTARQLFSDIKANPTRKRFGFGKMPALINIDLQKAYTNVGEFATAYETDPRQIEHVNALAAEFRARGFPVVWTYVAYMDSGEDCGVWGTRTNTPDSLQNIKVGSRRSEFDDRLVIDQWTPHETMPGYAPLAGGTHHVRVQYVQGDGWTELRLDVLRGRVRPSLGSAGPH